MKVKGGVDGDGVKRRDCVCVFILFYLFISMVMKVDNVKIGLSWWW